MLCSRCGVDQDRDQFGPSADNWPERRECKTCARGRSQARRHGLTAAQRAEVAVAQGGCRICGHPEPGSKGWVVDHDRLNCCAGDESCPKCRRGVICQWCNSVLGYAFDRVETLAAAVEYLNAPRTCEWHMPVACAPGICGSQMHGRNGQDGLTETSPNPQPQPSPNRRARSGRPQR